MNICPFGQEKQPVKMRDHFHRLLFFAESGSVIDVLDREEARAVSIDAIDRNDRKECFGIYAFDDAF